MEGRGWEVSVLRRGCEKHKITDAVRGAKAWRAGSMQSSSSSAANEKSQICNGFNKKRQSHIQVTHLLALRLSAFREASQPASQSAARELGISGQTLESFLVRSQPVDSEASALSGRCGAQLEASTEMGSGGAVVGGPPSFITFLFELNRN